MDRPGLGAQASQLEILQVINYIANPSKIHPSPAPFQEVIDYIYDLGYKLSDGSSPIPASTSPSTTPNSPEPLSEDMDFDSDAVAKSELIRQLRATVLRTMSEAV